MKITRPVYQVFVLLTLIGCSQTNDMETLGKAWCNCINEEEVRVNSGKALFAKCNSEVLKGDLGKKYAYLFTTVKNNEGINIEELSEQETLVQLKGYEKFMDYIDSSCCRRLVLDSVFTCEEYDNRILNDKNPDSVTDFIN